MVGLTFQPLGADIWEHSELISFCGASLPHRMTVIRLRDGSLLVHSPTRCDEATRHALRSLGEVAHVVAPNGMHDLFLKDYLAEFPKASLWIPPGWDKYFALLSRAEHLREDDQNVPWRQDLSCVIVQGVPRLNECAFYHAASKSLILADLLFNIQKHDPALIRIAARLGRFYRKLSMPPDIKWFLMRDKDAFRNSIHTLRSLPFENVIVGHGANVIGGGSPAFARAFAWLQ
jgi:hypothetical protein